jgi:hypothetical protein
MDQTGYVQRFFSNQEHLLELPDEIEVICDHSGFILLEIDGDSTLVRANEIILATKDNWGFDGLKLTISRAPLIPSSVSYRSKR